MAHQLAGKRVLIVEDEQMLAEYLADAMVAEGAEVIGPVATVNAALDVIANTPLDGVTLDLNVRAKQPSSRIRRINSRPSLPSLPREAAIWRASAGKPGERPPAPWSNNGRTT